jgi:NADH-quinone oxidoreductase subunit E
MARNLSDLDTQAQAILAKYDQKGAATLTLLHLAQDHLGHITPEVEQWVSKWTEVPPVHVREVVTFYSMYHRKPVGRNHVLFCTSMSCMLNGGDKLLCHLEKKLGVKRGETTKDGRVSIEEAQCLCNCEGAPMMSVAGEYHTDLTEKKIDQIMDGLK